MEWPDAYYSKLGSFKVSKKILFQKIKHTSANYKITLLINEVYSKRISKINLKKSHSLNSWLEDGIISKESYSMS